VIYFFKYLIVIYKMSYEPTWYPNGAIKSPPDDRDLIYSRPKAIGELPDKFSLKDHLSEPRSQGARGTCASFAASSIKECQEHIDCGFSQYMSPEFIYYHRKNRPSEGMFGRDVMNILLKIGSVPDYLYQYKSKDSDAQKPSDEVYAVASGYQIASYARVETIDDVKHALMNNGPCYISLPVYKHRPEFWRGGKDEKSTGGHAVSIIGWNTNGFILRNSWGSSWNGNGYIFFPYADFSSRWEIWTAIDKPKSPTPAPAPRMCCGKYCNII
jgi:hypothetical protein